MIHHSILIGLIMLLFVLFVTGLFAGTVDAIAGGGGMISVPVLLSVGISPHVAFGTNKLQSTIGTCIATRKYYQHGLISLKTGLPGIVFGIVGASLGAVTAQMISSGILNTIIPFMLIAILVYTIFSPRMGAIDREPRMSEWAFYAVFGFVLAFYDGFFGPGTGSFWVFLLSFFLGYNLIKATAYAKILNLNSNVIATICFALGGNIDYRLAACMAAGQLIGGRLGAALAIRNGASLIRPVFLLIVALTVLSLISRQYVDQQTAAQFLRQHVLMVVLFMLASVAVIYRKVWKQA